MKFCSLVLQLHLPQNFCHTHTDTQTDTRTNRHFSEIFKSCSGHPKTCLSIKIRKSIIFTKLILSSIHIEESKNTNHFLNAVVKQLASVIWNVDLIF